MARDLPNTASAGAGCTQAGSAVITHGNTALAREPRSQPRALAEAVLPVLRELTEEVQVERDRMYDTARLPDGTIPDGTIPDDDDRAAVAALDRSLAQARQTIRMLEGVR